MIYLKTLPLLAMIALANQPSYAQISNPLYDMFLNGLLSHTVDGIGVDELAQQQDSVVILDTRQQEEYEVSHIPNARWVGYEAFSESKIKDLPKDTPVVTYCSVGYRSEKIGERLQDMGFREVYNLQGGIFEWTNQQKPLYQDDTTPTNKIHPYSSTWGIWLQEGEKTYK